MFETIFTSITDILSYILMVIGCEEFIKNCIKRKAENSKAIDLNSIMQIVLCFIGSIAYNLKSGNTGNLLDFIINTVYIGLLLVSTTTLFYDLIIKRIKKESDAK